MAKDNRDEDASINGDTIEEYRKHFNQNNKFEDTSPDNYCQNRSGEFIQHKYIYIYDALQFCLFSQEAPAFHM